MKRFSLRERIRSFYFAFKGLRAVFVREHNSRIHALATVFVIVLAILFPTSLTETILLVFAVALVWITELVNTALESLCDFITVERRKQIEYIKDLSAAAVLIAAVAALLTGGIIFIPKIF